MRRFRAAFLLTCMSLAVLGIPSLPGQAASANCSNSSFGHNFFGYTRSPSGSRSSGAQANIEVRASDICDPPAGKLAQTGGHVGLYEIGGGGFARVGWLRQTSLGRDGFYSYTVDGSSEILATIGSVALGDTLKYKVSWQNGSDNKIHFIVCAPDGSNCTDFGNTPFNGDTWTDIQGRVVGFTNTNDADIPGVDATRADYRQIMWRDGTGAWGTASSNNITNGPNRYHLNADGNEHFQTWTNPT